MSWSIREKGSGQGAQPPTNTRPIRNPLKDPRIRASLRWAIIREHKLQTGETPWNNNRGNVLRENNAGVRVTHEQPPWVNLACNIPGATPAQNNTQRVDPFDRHKQELLNGVVDMRTKLLDSYFFLIFILVLLHFLTYIWFFMCFVKIVKGTNVYTSKQLYSIQKNSRCRTSYPISDCSLICRCK